ncbi:uncharacterized, partial [Tachysurus ichikawai]
SPEEDSVCLLSLSHAPRSNSCSPPKLWRCLQLCLSFFGTAPSPPMMLRGAQT